MKRRQGLFLDTRAGFTVPFITSVITPVHCASPAAPARSKILLANANDVAEGGKEIGCADF